MMLDQESLAAFGTVAVRATIEGIEVFLGDQRIGETSAGRAIVVENVSPGLHRVRARKAGYKAWDREVHVAANQRADIMVDTSGLARTKVPRPKMARRWYSFPRVSSGWAATKNRDRPDDARRLVRLRGQPIRRSRHGW
jgi:hypothetical protein